jgi:plastocyanin
VVRNVLLGVLVTSVAISAFAAVSVDDDVMAEGDVLVVAERAEFDPTELAVSSTSGVFIDNRDPVRHTFTVDALDVSVELPAGSARRIELDAPPGAYRFVCSVAGHESMTGTLVVNG